MRSAAAFAIALFALALAGCAGHRAPSRAASPAADRSRSVAPSRAGSSTRVETATPPPPATSATGSGQSSVEPAPPTIELPRGGRAIFPTHRLVGFCGTPGAPALGRLAGKLDIRAKEIERFGEKYKGERPILPVFELIAVIVQGSPGADGKWRRRVPDSVVDEYLAAARAAKALLVLNVQPGHSDFMTEVKHFEKYLKEPDVGLALDPEWAMKPKQKPGVFYGQTKGSVVHEVADYLATIVRGEALPEKLLVFHQVNAYVMQNEADVKAPSGVVVVKSVDGLGPKGAKIATYNALMKTMPEGVHAGFKLFFDEDTAHGWKLMTPAEVLTLRPEPEYVMYE